MTDPHYLFVYGTLRSDAGHPMHRSLAAGAVPMGSGTVPGTLYDLGPYPGLRLEPQAPGGVRGEVYRLREESAQRLLSMLDDYEGVRAGEVPGCLYRREKIMVALDDGPSVEAWAYLLLALPAAATPMPGGNYGGRHPAGTGTEGEDPSDP